MLVVGVMAATTVSLGVSVTVNYEPDVVAKVYVATSNPTNIDDKNYYFSGIGTFPETAFLVADNSTTPPAVISDTTIENAVCDIFGYYTIYVNVINYSRIDIQVSITMTKLDGTPSTKFTPAENLGISSIDAKYNETISSGFAVVKVKAIQIGIEALKFTVNLSQAT